MSTRETTKFLAEHYLIQSINILLAISSVDLRKMTDTKYLLVLLLALLPHPLHSASEEEPVTGLHVIEGSYKWDPKMDRNIIKALAEHLGTKPRHVRKIRRSPTIGNFEVKVIDNVTQEIEITIETLAGNITDRLKPNSTCELAWFDGRKFSVVKMWFENTFDREGFVADLEKVLELELEMGSIHLEASIDLGRAIQHFERGDFQFSEWFIRDWKNSKKFTLNYE